MDEQSLRRAVDRLERRGMEHLSSKYKPLTLLWLLGRMSAGKAAVVRWSEFRAETPDLFRRYGSPLPVPDARYPFLDLASSELWAVTVRAETVGGSIPAPSLQWLSEHDPTAGFTFEAATLLESDRVRAEIADRLIRRFVPDTDQAALRSDLGLSPPIRLLSDVRVRRAVELRAEDSAVEFLYGQGWQVKRVGALKWGYDLDCRDDLGGSLHVEVKGSQGSGDAVLLTRNEVNHVRDGACSAEHGLFVVSGIQVDRTGPDPVAHGGQHRYLNTWKPSSDDLEPTEYLYQVPIA